MHPLAGQGLNLGFADVQALTDCILRGVEQGKAPGDSDLLHRYACDRRIHNTAMLTGLDSIKRVFATDLGGPFGAVRNTGMSVVNAASPIKVRSYCLLNHHCS